MLVLQTKTPNWRSGPNFFVDAGGGGKKISLTRQLSESTKPLFWREKAKSIAGIFWI